jgi:F420-0:gamma-glutamyl ligase-like protein
MHTFKKLLLFSPIRNEGGNCKVLDETIVSSVPSTNKKVNPVIDVAIYRKYDLDVTAEVLEDHDYDVLPFFVGLSEVSHNVVTYISGYVVRGLKKIIRCSDCVYSLNADPDSIVGNVNYRWLFKKNSGTPNFFM